MASISPKVMRERPGSKRRATNPKMFSVANPNTTPQSRSYILLPASTIWARTNIFICVQRNLTAKLAKRTPSDYCITRYTEFMSVKAVFFDVGNTLLFPNHSEMLGPLHQRGIVPSPELLRALECRTKREFDSLQASESK